MRELKFRFYDVKQEKMIYGFQGCCMDFVLDMWERTPKAKYPQQYTGFKDMHRDLDE